TSSASTRTKAACPTTGAARMADAARVENARILATGAAGVIGPHWGRLAPARRPRAPPGGLGAPTPPRHRANPAGPAGCRPPLLHGDIREPATVTRAMEGCDVVVNFAAESMVDRSIEDPGSFLLTDTYGVFVLLEEAKRRGVARFVQISTDEVYGEGMGDPVTEEAALLPRNPYAASKAGGDPLAFAYSAP